jgi:Ni/Co efflux regulator RcnB
MKKALLFAASLGLAAAISLPAQERPPERQQERGQQERAQQERGKDQEHARGEYHFRQEDAPKLRQHYKNINRDMRERDRGHFVAGERLTGDWHKRMHPVPETVIAELPPPPPGYVFGYIDGYCVVYDPRTGYIADVIDLSNLP